MLDHRADRGALQLAVMLCRRCLRTLCSQHGGCGKRQPQWTVERVELRESEQAVQVFVEAIAGTTCRCLACGAAAPVSDPAERRWRPLDTG